MSKILRPLLPFRGGIPGGIYDGKRIEIRGKILSGVDRIGINLIAGFDPSSDRVLHFSIRFDENRVIRTHQKDGEWGSEERDGSFPFSIGSKFGIAITAERERYRIAVNDQHCYDFKHRLPMGRVQSIGIYGSTDVYEIEFIDRPIDAHRSIPNIPYEYSIFGGLKPGMTIDISGRPSSNANKFSINLQKGGNAYPPPDVAFHFCPLFPVRTVERNSRSDGVWTAEEDSTPEFPFGPGVNFDLMIRVEVDKFSVSVNGTHFPDFRHRLRPLEMFDTLYIRDDVSISSIRFS